MPRAQGSLLGCLWDAGREFVELDARRLAIMAAWLNNLFSCGTHEDVASMRTNRGLLWRVRCANERNLETRALWRFGPEFPRTRRRMVGCSREIVGLEGEEPQRAALRSFGSCDAVWRGDHLWSVFGMLGENLLSSTRGLWPSQLRGSMGRQGRSGCSREIVGLEGEEPSARALRRFGSRYAAGAGIIFGVSLGCWERIC